MIAPDTDDTPAAVQNAGPGEGRLLTATVERRSPRLAAVAHVVTLAGSKHAVFVPVALYSVRARNWRVLAGCLAGAAVRHGLEELIGRRRPPKEGWLEVPSGSSMPSRHTAETVLTTLLVTDGLTGSARAAMAAGGVAGVLVGWSRLVLGVHWPTDVIAGAAFAFAWWALFRRVILPR
ncbi:phosphatase PAP2 family protein [Herbidospora daliensis]|uniref:phosphatase PAP2 family protein n=1 Tax=Herbidospora daliensis TaxID=295585 RepID=UPI0007855B17|nr:phosphatase PAP2 family protein [Herbidospora daliensis]